QPLIGDTTVIMRYELTIGKLRSLLDEAIDRSRKMPPRAKWPDPYMNIQEDIIDITLRPNVLQESVTNEYHLQDEIYRLNKIAEMKTLNLTSYQSNFHKYVAMTDLQQKLAGGMQSKNYQRYPQLVDIPDFVNRINRGDPVSE
ncbi:hypothetical protein Ciccas_013134, partial [Cichlidogyrus casuarinus]